MSGKILRICAAVILCLSVDTQAIDLMGPPTATHKALQLSLGLEYSHSEENVQFTDHGSIPLNRLKNVRRNVLSGKFGVGLVDFFELFFRIGTGTLQANEIDFDDNTDPIKGAGAKVTFYRGDRIDLGALFQWNIFEGETTGFIEALGIRARKKMDIDEQHLAVGATVKMDGWRLYGGPFYYVFDGDVTIKEVGNPTNQIRPDVEEESEYGGFIGAQFDLGTKTSLMAECATTGEAWGAGIGLTWMF